MGEMGSKVVLSSFVLLDHRKTWPSSPLCCIEGIPRFSGMCMAHGRSNDKCQVKLDKFSIFHVGHYITKKAQIL